MTGPRLILALVLTASLASPIAVAAQEDVEAGEAPAPTLAAEDTRLAELEALVPEFFAGLPLRENMQMALGESLAPSMDDDERAVFETMLETNGKGFSDYAAASIPVRVDDSNVIVLQPHRVTGIDAIATLETWSEILGLNAERPAIDTVVIAGQDVVRVDDDARPDFPRLHLFAAGDVVWMVVAQDEAVIEEAVRTFTLAPSAAEAAE